MHMRHYVNPLQRLVMRLIWMVPIYSLQSWWALIKTTSHTDAFFLVTARECYEAYCLYAFYQLMLESLGGKERLAYRLVKVGRVRSPCPPPCCCLRGWKMGSRFVHRNTVGVYQYVLLRVMVSLMAFAAESGKKYNEGVWDFKYFFPYASITINCSQMVALYCLAMFYLETKQWLRPLSPLTKLCGRPPSPPPTHTHLPSEARAPLNNAPTPTTPPRSTIIKAVVFVTWWQGLAISIASSMDMIKPTLNYSKVEVGMAIQNFAICVEMFFAALAHHYYFSYRDWYPTAGRGPTAGQDISASIAALDEERRAEGAVSGGGRGGGGGSSNGRAATAPRGGSSRRTGEDARADFALELAAVGGAGGSKRGTTPGAAPPAASPRAPSPPGATETLEPMGYRAAALDMLPFDVLSETAVLARTGFGLTHKWDKRAAQARAELHNAANATWEEYRAEASGALQGAGGATPGGAPLPSVGFTPRAGGAGEWRAQGADGAEAAAGGAKPPR